jgi:L-lactate utilization protein LutB
MGLVSKVKLKMGSVITRISSELQSVIKQTRSNVKETLGQTITLTKASRVVAGVIKGKTVKVTVKPKGNVRETIELKF